MSSRPVGDRYGLPVSITVLHTPEGWRHSVTTARSGIICGRLAAVPESAPVGTARRAAAAMIEEIGREFHGVGLEVAWERTDPDSASGAVRVVDEGP